MGRKVFISVLGTGFYNECNYYSGDFALKTRFIQQAALAMLCSQCKWTDNDAAYILLTDGAKKNNWNIPSNTRKNPKSTEEEQYIGLEDELSAMHLPVPIESVDIKDGKDEKEMWDIFDTIYNLLQEGDELYFDITHGFRYLPMFVVVLGNYAKFLKGITVKGITYGNFEAKNDNGAPIMDLLSLSTLQNWTNAAADFLRHGDAKQLKECGMSELTPILRETRGQNAAASNLRGLCNALSNFSEELSFCRGMDILAGKSADDIKSLMADADKNCLRPFVPLFEDIKNTVASFSNDAPANIIHAARLCFSFGNYQASATLLEEGVKTFFCRRHGIKADDDNLRETVGQAFIKKLLIAKGEEYKYNKSDKEEFEMLVDRIATDSLIDENLINSFTSLKTNVRNDINHAGMRSFKIPAKPQNLRSNLDKVLGAMEVLVENNSCERVVDAEPVPSLALPPILVNLSNHPNSEWQEEQRKAAEQYGDITDMPFPQIAPDADDKQMNELVKQYIEQIKPYTSTHKVTVHIMGEMCFTYRLVRQLSKKGIKCICSTTFRIVRDEGNGKRYVEFHFKKFRDYE